MISAIPKYFLSGLLGAYTAALHAMFAVKHLLSSGHSALFLQLLPWLLKYFNNEHLLSKKLEFISKCRHENKLLVKSVEKG